MNTPPTPNHKFYIYSYTDVRPDKEGNVIYIGKGSFAHGLRRMEKHWKGETKHNTLFSNVLMKIRTEGLEPIREVISWHETEWEAFEAEICNIAKHKLRCDGGTLCNLTKGGEGATGHRVGVEARKRISESATKMWQSEEFRKSHNEKMRQYYDDPEFIERMSTSAREMWNNPEFRKAMLTPERQARSAEITTGMWLNPAYREKVMAGYLEAQQRPEVKSRKSESSKKIWTDPEIRARMTENIGKARRSEEARKKTSEINKEIWSTPGVREKFGDRMREVLNNPAEKVRKAAATKALWADPVFREKQRIAREARLSAKAPTQIPQAG